MGLWEAALNEYRYIVERRSGLIDAYLYVGQILQLLEREKEATAIYERALQAAKKEATRHHLTGMIAFCQRRDETAISEFKLAILLEPHQSAHRHMLGLTHLRSESYLQALQVFDECLKYNSGDVVALTYSNKPLLGVARTKEAEQRLVRALELDPGNVPALKALADMHSQRGALISSDEGRITSQCIQKGLRLAPHTAEARESLAIYHIFRGQWATGITALRAFTEQHPHNPLGWTNLARWLFHTGATEAAAHAILKGQILHPGHWETQLIACKIFTCTGNRERLHFMLQELLAQYPERWNVWITAARALIRVFKNPDQACAVAALAPRRQPQLAAAWFEFGRVLALCSRHHDALAALEKGWGWLSVEACDKQAVLASILSGESFRHLGEEDRAQAWFERAVRKTLVLANHSPGIAYYRRGYAMEALRDPVGAIQAYQASLAHHLLYPWRREAQSSLERLQARARPSATS